MAKIRNTSKITSKFSLPDGSQKQNESISNEVQVENLSESFVKTRTSAKDFAERNSELEQTLTLTNNSEFEITDVKIKDNIIGGTFKAGSVTIDGVAFESYDVSVGFNLGESIKPNDTKTIKYVAITTDSPDLDLMQTIANITYSVGEQKNIVEVTNKVEVSIVDEKITILKQANVQVAIKGDTITFTNIVKNEGKNRNTEVFFMDSLPAGVTLVEGSVKIDDVVQAGFDPNTGFNLKDLEINDEVKVEFQVKVD